MMTFDLDGTFDNDDLTSNLPNGAFNARGRGGDDTLAGNGARNQLFGDWNPNLKAGDSRDVADWFRSGIITEIYQTSTLRNADVNKPTVTGKTLTWDGSDVVGNTGLFLVSEQWQVFGDPDGVNDKGVSGYQALTGLGVRNLADTQNGGSGATNQAITKGEVLGFKLAEPMFGITIGLQHFHVHTPDGDEAKKFAETAVVTLFNGNTEVLRVKVAATGQKWHWDGSGWKAGLPTGWGGALLNGNDVYATQNINGTLTFNRGESELVLTNRTGNAALNFDRVEVSADDVLKIGSNVPDWATSGLFVRSIDVRPTGGNDLIQDGGGRDTIMGGPDTGELNVIQDLEEPSLSYYAVTDGDRIELAADNTRDTIIYYGGHGVDVITGFKTGGAAVGGDLLRLHQHAGNWRYEVETIDFKDGSATPVASTLIRAFHTNGTATTADDIEDGAIVLVGVTGLVQGTDYVFV